MPDGNLSDRDRALRDAARIVAEEVRRLPSPVEGAAAEKAMAEPTPVEADASGEWQPSKTGEADETSDPLQDFVAARRATLEEVDRLLDGGTDER